MRALNVYVFRIAQYINEEHRLTVFYLMVKFQLYFVN